MPRKPALISDARAPELRDPRWAMWSKPVLDYLAHPRSWRALRAWNREHRFGGAKLRHCLAWLESEGLAQTYGEETRLRWGRCIEPT